MSASPFLDVLTRPSLPVLPTNSPVGQAYDKWREHYEECQTCQHDDWYSPFMGEPLFCDKGRPLFRTWARLTQVSIPPLS